MNDELSSALLRELAERLKAVEQHLADIQAANQEMSKTYSKSQEQYRQALAKRTQGDPFRAIAVVLMLLLLAYIAYRVS